MILMEKYFRLHPYVVLADGTNQCAVYNLLNGKVYCISKEEYMLLNKCEQNTALNKIGNVDYTFLNDLKNKELGLDYDSKIFVDKHFYGRHRAMIKIINTVALDTLFVEVTNRCNLNCKFCKEDDVLYRKTGCKKWLSKGKVLSVQEWRDIIIQAKYLHCHNFIIIGGEPFLEFEKIKEIVCFIKENIEFDTKITIYTNGVLLDNEKIVNFIEKYQINIWLQILSDNNKTYYEITGEEKLFNKISSVIKQLIKHNINYRLSLLVNKFNENEVENIIENFKHYISIEYIYPIKNNFFSHKYLKQIYDKNRSFVKLSLPLYDKISKYHNCYKGMLAISCDGSIYPCIMSRQLYLGNIHDITIRSILSSPDYTEYSKLHKGKIEHCKKCHKRYGCFDCRALEMSATNDIYGMRFCDFIEGFNE